MSRFISKSVLEHVYGVIILFITFNLSILSVPDEGYYSNVPDEGYYSNVPDEGYYSNVPDEGYYSNVSDEGYCRHDMKY
jgi:hypothetical protein